MKNGRRRQALAGDEERAWPVEGMVKYRHFVDVAWVFLYPILDGSPKGAGRRCPSPRPGGGALGFPARSGAVSRVPLAWYSIYPRAQTGPTPSR